MSDEDFEPFVGGPPPDPSERTWRHPSEVGAHARSIGGPTTPGVRRPGASTWRPGSATGLLVAGSLGAAVCLVAIAVFQAAGPTEPATMLTSAALGDATLGDATLGDQRLGDQSLAEGVAASGLGAGGRSATERSIEIAPTTVGFDPGGDPPPSTGTDPAPGEPGAPLPASVVTAASHHLVTVLADTNTTVNGVILDGYLFTSADAVDHRLSVSYQWQDRSTVAYLVGIDPYSDLAVFRPSGEIRANQVVRALTTELIEARPGEVDPQTCEVDPQTCNVEHETAIGDSVTVVSHTEEGLVMATGTVLSLATNSVSASGKPLIGLLDTSVRRPERPGALLLDTDGDVAGIVVGTSSTLASALPSDTALAIAERLTDQGWASETWIGFMGIDRDNGVEVVDVTEDGPAARADLRPGDVIRFLDGAPVDHMGGITAALRQASPGDTLVMRIQRAGELITLPIEAVAFPVDAFSGPIDG